MAKENNNNILGEATRRDRMSGIIMLHEYAKKCNRCKEHLARLHYNRFQLDNGHGRSKNETWFYCDCMCGHGTVTGWYPTKEEAIEAWNNRVWIDKETDKIE